MDYICRIPSPLGEITLSSDGQALTGLWFEGQKHFAAMLAPDAKACMLPVFCDTQAWLDLYFSAKQPDFTPPLCPKGTPFQQEVWSVLLTIPYGQTMTYGEIAMRIAKTRGTSRMSARAVGSAVGRNPISLIIPCHRVIGTDGSLTGYAGGIARKMHLLALEKASFQQPSRKE